MLTSILQAVYCVLYVIIHWTRDRHRLYKWKKFKKRAVKISKSFVRTNFDFSRINKFFERFKKTIVFYWTNIFLEQNLEKIIAFLLIKTIFLNERFYKRIVKKKTDEIDGKWTMILRTNEIKRMKWVVYERWTNIEKNNRQNYSIFLHESVQILFCSEFRFS